MTDRYVRSSDGDNASDSLSWNNAKANATGVVAIDGVGDRIFFSSAHSEDNNSADVTIALAGTLASPSIVMSVSDAAEPPTTPLAGAVIQTSGTWDIFISGSGYVYGMTFKAGVGSTALVVIRTNSVEAHTQIFEDCTFELATTGSTSGITVGSSTAETGRTELINPTFKFGHASQGLSILYNYLTIRGGRVSANGSGVVPTNLFRGSMSNPAEVNAIGMDLTACGTNLNLFHTSGQNHQTRARFIRFLLPNGWDGGLVSGSNVHPGSRVELIDSYAGTTRYRYWLEEPYGSVRDDTTRYAENVTYDGVTRYSLKFAGSTNCNNRSGRLVGPEMLAVVETASVAHTAKVQILHDGATALNTQQARLEVFDGTSWVSDGAANVLATAAAHDTSTVTWFGDSGAGAGPNGSATWHQLELSCSFTPTRAGPVLGRVVCMDNVAFYADINLTVAAV